MVSLVARDPVLFVALRHAAAHVLSTPISDINSPTMVLKTFKLWLAVLALYFETMIGTSYLYSTSTTIVCDVRNFQIQSRQEAL